LTVAAALSLTACQEPPEAIVEGRDPHNTAVTAPAALSPPPGRIVAGEPVEVVAHPDQRSLLNNEDPALAANKRLMFDMWRAVLNAGHLEVADALVAQDYIQHSPFQRSGRQALKDVFSVIPRSDEVPEEIRPSPVTIVAEDDLVVFVAVEALPEPDGSGTYTTTHFNMFRVANGRLAEHWHPDRTPPCPDLPSAAAGGPQPVTGVSGAAQLALLDASSPALANNKRLVFDAGRQLVDAGREALTELYLAEDYIQHNPNAATGREAAQAHLATREDLPIETSIRGELVAMVAEGDLVVQVIKVELPNPYRQGETYTTAWFDMFRIADGRLAEHWDAAVKPGTAVEEMGSECAQPAE
jgi:predicted SnoaL-like aldol condensation-catalyzing enzyme